MPRRRKKEQGRPMELRYPPRIDAPPEVIANVVLNAKPRPPRFGSGKPTEYRCKDCDRDVSYPDTLYQDGRCKSCHTAHVGECKES